jgi:hypothetical protein
MTPPNSIAAIYFTKAVKFAKQSGAIVVAYKLPADTTRSTYDIKKHNTVKALCDDLDINFIDFYEADTFHAAGLTLGEDFNDDLHMNVIGAAKVSRYLGEYLVTHYDLPDRRDDTKTSIFKDAVKSYEKSLIEVK